MITGFYSDLYSYMFYLVVKETRKSVARKLKRDGWPTSLDLEDIDWSIDTCRPVSIRFDEEPLALIYYPVFKQTSPIHMETITHEIHHAVNGLLRYIHAKPDIENDEHTAYLHGWLASLFYEELREKSERSWHTRMTKDDR